MLTALVVTVLTGKLRVIESEAFRGQPTLEGLRNRGCSRTMKWFLSAYRYSALLMVILGTTVFLTPLPAQEPAFPPDPPVVVPPVVLPVFSMKVVSGQNGANIVKRRIATVPVIEVRDQNDRPVAGAVVNFTAPDLGPSVTFITGGRTFSAVTELDGRARASGVVPVSGAGKFKITVTARYDDRIIASTAVDETNYGTASDAERAGATVPVQSPADRRDAPKSGLSRGAITAIVIAIAAGAVAGIAISAEHK